LLCPDDVLTAFQIAEQAARDSRARLLVLLAGRLRDISAAEDALADAFALALAHWPQSGVPDRPEAWLMTAAKRAAGHAKDRTATAQRAVATLVLMAQEQEDKMTTTRVFPDHRLGLMFACTHPAIDADTQTPLMLQVILGLTADRIAPAFLITASALGQRLARAKARLKSAHVTFELPGPDELANRLPPVMEAVLAAAALGWEGIPGSDPTRADLASEAAYLAELLAELTPQSPEPRALLALVQYVTARAPARKQGYIPLADQNTDLWDRNLIRTANQNLRQAASVNAGRPVPGRFQLQAAIQSVHAARASTGITDWAALDLLYAAHNRHFSTIGSLVAAVAVTMERSGPVAAILALDQIKGIDGFQPAHALRAEALFRAGNQVEARIALARALGLAEDPALRDWLARRAAYWDNHLS
jgi:RNA polymerase sigma-70 factor, ECF subfamily